MEKLKQRVEIIKAEEASHEKIDEEKLKNYGLTDITLRPYQMEGVNWLASCYHRNHGCILGDEMGLGKTCQTISLLVYLVGSEEGLGPHLILSPLSVLNNWKTELAKFAPKLEVVTYVGDKSSREELKKEIKRRKDEIQVILTTYEICLKDESFLHGFSWHTLVVDEAHRLKNRESLLHQALSEFDVAHTVLLTGTPVQNNLTELYALLHFIYPELFHVKYMDDFLDTFHDVQPNSKEMNLLHDLLMPFILRRVKSQVIKDLPGKTEVILFHGMSALQKKYYRGILTKDTDVFKTGNTGVKTKLMNILMQLRKCVNHPYLFDGVEPEPFELGEHLVEASGKLLLIDQLLMYLRPLGHKVLLFSQMTRMLDIVQDYLGYRGFTYERLDGSVRGEERYLAVQNFNSDEDTFVFLLSTKAGGQGLNLVSADTVIFIDSDFNPQNDLQAAARAHRIGQTRAVKVIRLVGRSTVEEVILRRAEAKLKLTETVIEKGNFSLGADTSDKESLIANSKYKLQDILKFGVDKLFANEDDSTIENVDFDKILGPSKKGKWAPEVDQETQACLATASMELAEDDDAADNMYVYKGKDYSKLSEEDLDTFQKLLADKEEEDDLEDDELQTGLRRQSAPGGSNGLVKPRKKLSPEELEQRRKRLTLGSNATFNALNSDAFSNQKRAELAAQREREAEEAERQKEQRRKARLQALWKSNNYKSLNISLDSEGEDNDKVDMDNSDDEVAMDTDDEDENGNHGNNINYIVGDVTKPVLADGEVAYIVHCVDDSGYWGSGGVFSAISAHSKAPVEHYELAGKMKDLNLGDAHLIAFNKDDEGNINTYMALIVAQQRDRKNNLSGIKLPSLAEGLKRIAHAAKMKRHVSVHLPRIGHNTPGFNWYGTERLIRKYLISKGIKTYVYYYKRKARIVKRRISSSEEEEEEKPRKARRHSSPQPSTSSASSYTSSSQRIKTPNSLPDFMTGVAVHFHQVSAPSRQLLARYLIAYNGDVHNIVSSCTTHIVVEDLIFMDAQNIKDYKEQFPAIEVTTKAWLFKCFKQQKLIGCKDLSTT